MDETVNTSSESSSIGEAVSGRGGRSEGREEVSDEEDDIYYIPERRPSLDLGSSPMDTGNWCFVEQAVSPVQSYGTMSSEEDLAEGENEDGYPTGIHLERTDSFSSCYSIDSDNCEKKTLKVKSKDEASPPPDNPELALEPEEPLHPSYTVGFVFMAICKILKKLLPRELECFKITLWNCYPEFFKTSPRSMDMVDLVDRLLECYSLDASLKITHSLLTKMSKRGHSDSLKAACIRNEVCHDLREHLKKKYGEVDQDSAVEGKKRSFLDIYTNLSLSSIPNNGPNTEHEVMTIQKLHTNTKKGKQLSTKEIFEPPKDGEVHSNCLFITGAAGSGKSMIFRRFIFDWIEQQTSESILIPLTIQELKQFEDSEISFVEIVQKLYPETAHLKLSDYGYDRDFKMVVIVDGLDELSKEIEFGKIVINPEPMEPTSLKVNLASLFVGRLITHGSFVAICRPHVKSWLAWDMRYKVMEVCGFTDSEKDEYFKKRFEDSDQANRVIEYVKSFKTLHIMCHLPLFCSLVADECQLIFREKGTQAELPRSITYMYTKLLLALLHQGRFRNPFCEPGKEGEFLMMLGKFALGMLERGEFALDTRDWMERGMSTDEELNHCGLFTQFTVTVDIFYTEKMQSFIHPTMQEYLAALYAYLSFKNQGKNIFEQQLKDVFRGILKGPQLKELYKSAVERSLQREDGKLDMFLCFLSGMAHKTTQELLHHFCSPSSKISDSTQSFASVINKKMGENPGRSSNLQRCLQELGV